MASLFTKIIQGEIPCFKVHEDDQFLAFLDINPLQKGHTLVIPKLEIDYIFDLDDQHLSQMMVFAKKVSVQLKQKFPCTKIGIAVIGLEVPHAHIHLIPINKMKDMDFSGPKLQLTSDELSEMSKALQASF